MRLGRKAMKAFEAGDITACEKLTRKALAIMERTFGDAGATGGYTFSLGGILAAQNRYAEALPLYERALLIFEKSHGPEHPMFANTLNKLADLNQSLGRYDDSEQQYERALAILEKAFEPEHPDVAMSLENYAALLRQTGRAREAKKMEARAKAIRAKSK